MPVRLVAVWVGLVLAFGTVAAATATPSGDDESVAASDGTDDAAPRRASTTTSTSTTAPITTSTTAAPVVEVTATTLPALVIEAPPTTEPVEEVAVTAPPAAGAPGRPPFTMSSDQISTNMAAGGGEAIRTSGEGCTGPGHTGVEYGVVGVVTTEQGLVYDGDYVASSPDGHWESSMFFGEVGTHRHHYRCQRLDGTVLFEYEPRSFTVTG